jgi:hypothetical protein
MMKKHNYIIFASMVFSILAITGCKKYDNPPPVYEDLKLVSNVQRKVLVISIDGVTGSEIKTIAPTNITELQKTSKYSFDMLKSGISNDVSSWVTMVTGVGFSKHSIGTANFDRLKDPNANQHAEIKSYRNMLDYITQYKAIKTAVITPWDGLRKYLINADFSPIVSTDVAVKDSTINILIKQDNVGAVVVNFRDVEAAGANGGFVAANANYKNAITKADEYVGNLTAALKTRKNYANEDWLIIVTTNHGGSNIDPKNGFLIVSQKNLKQQEVLKTGFNSAVFKTVTSRATPVNGSTSLFDAGLAENLTVQMETKFNTNNVNYPTFLSKSTNLDGGTITGWQWGHYGDKFIITTGGSANGGSGKLDITSTINPGTDWHTLTMSIATTVNGSGVPTARTLKMFVDGNLQGSLDILSRKSLANTEMFRIGHRKGDTDTPTPFYGANLQYFNVALSDAVIKSNIGLKNITQHPNYANLIGFWPMSEGAESVLGNKIAGGVDLSLSGVYTWDYLNSLYPPGSVNEPITSNLSVIAKSSDVAALSLYWLKINILPEFGFDGNPFLNKFEIEFLK